MLDTELLTKHIESEIESAVIGSNPDPKAAQDWINLLFAVKNLPYMEEQLKRRNSQ